MLMVTEPRKAIPSISNALRDPDVVAVCGFAVIGLLLTIAIARVFPLDKAVDLIMLFG
jgi:hypothetical protein